MFSFLFCAYKILNPTNANDRNTSSYVVHSSQSTSLYDVMESDDDMTLLVVKGQLTHLKIKKVNEEECKDPLAWWKTHELNFSYVGMLGL